MTAYLIRRLLLLVPVLLFVALITFALMHLAPGGPWSGERQLPAAVQRNLNEKYGLDLPLHEQFGLYLSNLLRGDLGLSFSKPGRSVQEVLGGGIGVTVQLGLMAALVSLLVGVPLGVIAALRHNSALDYGGMLVAILGYTTPSFVLGIFLIVLFAVQLRVLPASGWGRPASVILPTIALAAAPIAILARYTRASVLDIMQQDYVRTARAKGLAERAVVARPMMRNALLPVITVLGPVTAALVTGSFVVERLFRVPGIGRMYIDAIFARDYPLIMGTTLLYAVTIAVFNLVVDMLYVVVDPRISYS
jgi:oligopeptide transport system permease protein